MITRFIKQYSKLMKAREQDIHKKSIKKQKKNLMKTR